MATREHRWSKNWANHFEVNKWELRFFYWEYERSSHNKSKHYSIIPKAVLYQKNKQEEVSCYIVKDSLIT